MHTKKMIKGSIIEMLPTILLALVEIVKMRIYVDYIGSEMNGYYQFINQLIGYLFLIEAGMSGAAIYKMFKPVAKKDTKEINALYSGNFIIYRRIALIMLGLLIVMLGIFPFIIKNNMAELITVIITFILIGLANIASFILYSRSLVPVFYANQDKYVIATISNIMKLITNIISIILIIKIKSIIVIGITIFIFKILEEMIILIVAKKKYPYLEKVKEADTSASKMTKDLIWHQIGGLSANNVDSLVLMFLYGPVMVSIYAAYNYVYYFINDLVGKITSTVSNALGIMVVDQEETKVYKSYNDYIYFCFLIGLIVSLCYLIGIRSFVNIWIDNSDYIISFWTVFFFASSLFINIIYTPLVNIINVKGLYKETKYYTLIGAIINFVLSFILAIPFGITGVLMATAISSFVNIILRVNAIKLLVFKNIDKKKMLLEYLYHYLIFSGICLIFLILEKFILSNTHNYLIWFMEMGGSFLIISSIILFIGYKTNHYLKKLITNLIFRKEGK